MTIQKPINKESGMAQFEILIAVVLIIILIATIIAGLQSFLETISKIPGLGGWADTIPNALASILRSCQGLASWALQGHFLNEEVGVTDLAQIVGWKTVRDLANIFLLLGLIFAAFGIMLGLKEYEAKKILPILILIALLINFTPVICGFIIDFANYITDWLLKGAIPDDTFVDKIEEGEMPSGFVSVFIFSLFVMIAAVTYLFFFVLFMGRYIFLLVLTIFSPIAFASKVFSPSEKAKKFFPSFLYWDTWWNQFLQWCTVGIFASFFMLIGNQIMLNMNEIQGSSPEIGFMGSTIVYLFPIFTLFIGLMSSLEAAQGVAGLVTSNVAKVGGFLMASSKKLPKPIAQLGKEVSQDFEKAGLEKIEKFGVVQPVKRWASDERITKEKEISKDIEERKENFQGKEAKFRWELTDKKDMRDMAAFAMATAEKGDEGKVLEELKDEEKEEYINKRNDALTYLEKINPKGYKETVKRSPHWITDEKKRKETFASLPPLYLREKINKESFNYLKENRKEAEEIISQLSRAQLKAITEIEDVETRELAKGVVEENLQELKKQKKLKPNIEHYLTNTDEGKSLWNLEKTKGQGPTKESSYYGGLSSTYEE